MNKSTAVQAAASVAVGAVLGAIVVTTGTLALTESSRPQIDRSADADFSVLHTVDYGRTTSLK